MQFFFNVQFHNNCFINKQLNWKSWETAIFFFWPKPEQNSLFFFHQEWRNMTGLGSATHSLWNSTAFFSISAEFPWHTLSFLPGSQLLFSGLCPQPASVPWANITRDGEWWGPTLAWVTWPGSFKNEIEVPVRRQLGLDALPVYPWFSLLSLIFQQLHCGF